MSDAAQMDGGSKTGLWLALGLVLLVGGLGLRSYMQEEPTVELSIAERYRRDPRLSHFQFGGCAFGRTFDADTSDMLPVLVRKLDGKGGVSSLQYAKRDVAAAGEAAIPHLTRLLDEVDQDPYMQGVVQNVIETCNLMEGDWGLPLVRRGIQHPDEAVMLKAVAGLRRHGDASDYDAVMQRFQMSRTPNARTELASALNDLDHARLAEEFPGWLADGLHSDVYKHIAPKLCDVTRPDLVATYRERAAASGVGPLIRTYLIAPSARDGDLSSLEELLERADGPALQLAIGAIKALGLVGLGDRVGGPFLDHESPDVRMAAAEVLVAHALEDEDALQRIQPTLARGLEDLSPEVRSYVRESLLRQAFEPAIADCIQDLRGHPSERREAIRQLHQTWDAVPDAVQRAFDVLRVRIDEPLTTKDRIDVCNAMGLVPTREAAELLFSQEPFLPEVVGGVDRHHFVCGMVFNTGEAGRALLRERLASETDPFRRLGLISFIWQDHEDVSRETLIEAFLDTEQSPYERLLIAELLVKMGPAQRVAPMIKRAYLDITDPDVRPALQCLLWAHFGEHFED